MKVLVTGGLGYIGSVLVQELIKNGLNVEIIDNNLFDSEINRDSFTNEEKKRLSVKIMDIRNKEIVESIKNNDVIVNLAAIVGDPACLNDTKEALDINCNAMRNIVEACKKYDKRIIHLSTCSVYGSEPNKILTEEINAYAIDFYGITKENSEEKTWKKRCHGC